MKSDRGPRDQAPGAVDAQAAAVAIDAGDLPLGGGLLALLRPALARLQPGGALALLSSSSATAEDLPGGAGWNGTSTWAPSRCPTGAPST